MYIYIYICVVRVSSKNVDPEHVQRNENKAKFYAGILEKRELEYRTEYRA